MAAKPPHETLPLFSREKEFPSTFLSDDGLQLLVQGTAFPMQLLLAFVICFELQEAPFLHLAYQYIPNYFFSHWDKSHKRLLADNGSAFISI